MELAIKTAFQMKLVSSNLASNESSELALKSSKDWGHLNQYLALVQRRRCSSVNCDQEESTESQFISSKSCKIMMTLFELEHHFC